MAASGAAFTYCGKYFKRTIYPSKHEGKYIFCNRDRERFFGALWTLDHLKIPLTVAFTLFIHLERDCYFDSGHIFSVPIADKEVEVNVVNSFSFYRVISVHVTSTVTARPFIYDSGNSHKWTQHFCDAQVVLDVQDGCHGERFIVPCSWLISITKYTTGLLNSAVTCLLANTWIKVVNSRTLFCNFSIMSSPTNFVSACHLWLSGTFHRMG